MVAWCCHTHMAKKDYGGRKWIFMNGPTDLNLNICLCNRFLHQACQFHRGNAAKIKMIIVLDLKSKSLKENVPYYGLWISNSAAWSLPNSSCPNRWGVRFTGCSDLRGCPVSGTSDMLWLTAVPKLAYWQLCYWGLSFLAGCAFDPDPTCSTSWQDVCSPHQRWLRCTFGTLANISSPCATETCVILYTPLKKMGLLQATAG